MFESSEEIAQNKLILLYLLKSINISVTNSEMCQFALEKRIMDYFSVQSCIEELCETGLFHSYKENGFTWYEITDEGTDMLELFAQKKGSPNPPPNRVQISNLFYLFRSRRISAA